MVTAHVTDAVFLEISNTTAPQEHGAVCTARWVFAISFLHSQDPAYIHLFSLWCYKNKRTLALGQIGRITRHQTPSNTVSACNAISKPYIHLYTWKQSTKVSGRTKIMYMRVWSKVWSDWPGERCCCWMGKTHRRGDVGPPAGKSDISRLLQSEPNVSQSPN